jgi:hypothetical protein
MSELVQFLSLANPVSKLQITFPAGFADQAVCIRMLATLWLDGAEPPPYYFLNSLKLANSKL